VLPHFYPFARIVHLLDVLTLNFALHPYCRSLGLDAIIVMRSRQETAHDRFLLAAAARAEIARWGEAQQKRRTARDLDKLCQSPSRLDAERPVDPLYAGGPFGDAAGTLR
jgi:hypothetical protein